MALESLGQEMLDLIKDLITKSMVFGRNAKSKKYCHGGSEIKGGTGERKKMCLGLPSIRR